MSTYSISILKSSLFLIILNLTSTYPQKIKKKQLLSISNGKRKKSDELHLAFPFGKIQNLSWKKQNIDNNLFTNVSLVFVSLHNET